MVINICGLQNKPGFILKSCQFTNCMMVWGGRHSQGRGVVGYRLRHQTPWVSTHVLPPVVRGAWARPFLSVTWCPYPSDDSPSIMLAVWWLLTRRGRERGALVPRGVWWEGGRFSVGMGASVHVGTATGFRNKDILKDKHTFINFLKRWYFKERKQRKEKCFVLFFKAAWTHVYLPCICPSWSSQAMKKVNERQA